MEATDKNDAHNSCSAGIKDKDILHDLLLIIKSITEEEASVSLKTVENILECSIDISRNLPSVSVLYKNSRKTVSEKYFNFSKSKRVEDVFPVYNESFFNLKTLVKTESFKESIISTLVEEDNTQQMKKIEDVLHDLLIVIEYIIKGDAFISSMFIENVYVCRIDVSECQPSLILFYKNHVKDLIETKKHSNDSSMVSKACNNLNMFLEDIPLTKKYKKVELLNKIKIEKLSEFPQQENLEQSLFKESSKNKDKGSLGHTNNSSKGQHERNKTVERQCVSPCCNKTFRTTSEKMPHKKTRTSEKPYACRYCDKTYTTNSRKRKHEKFHTAPRNWACTYCDRRFRCNSKKVAHERTHTGEKPFSCRYCNKMFSTKHGKKNHEKYHTDQKTFVCSYCDKTFWVDSEKRVHERSHTGEKPYTCSYCDKTFTSNSGKRKHERHHTDQKPLVCTYCDKRFWINSKKIRHERSHTGEKPYACTYCDKMYRTSELRRYHERIHTGEKPYACNYCDKKFRSPSLKHSHERTHNGENTLCLHPCDKTFIILVDERFHEDNSLFACTNCDTTFICSPNELQREKKLT